VGTDPAHRKIARCLVDAWTSDVANAEWMNRLLRAAEAQKAATRSLRSMNQRWKAFAACLDECRRGEPPWHPDLGELRRRAMPLGLEWARIPNVHKDLRWSKLLAKAWRRCTQNRREAWRDYLERSSAPPLAVKLLDHYGEAADEYAEHRERENRLMDSVIMTPPRSTELQEALRGFLEIIDTMRPLRDG
jgi:hypothetical protein